MQQILKRLELIKIAISLEDTETIILQLQQLKALDNSINIIKCLEKKDYQAALSIIDDYLAPNKTIENYVVCLVDILGQKNILNKLNSSVMQNDPKKVNLILNMTYGKIENFRKNMAGALTWLNEVTQTDDPLFDSADMKISSFSDLVVSYVSLRDDTHKVSLKGIYYLLFGNGLVFLQLLSEQTACRGGIDLGIGLEHQHQNQTGTELYGSTLSNSYYLESEIAKYPRIVIGEKLLQFIQDTADDNDPLYNNDAISHNIHFAKMCIKIIKQDIDKKYILDYLSEPFRQLENFDFHFKRAEIFKGKQYDNFVYSKAEKEVEKYKYLFKYFRGSSIA